MKFVVMVNGLVLEASENLSKNERGHIIGNGMIYADPSLVLYDVVNVPDDLVGGSHFYIDGVFTANPNFKPREARMTTKQRIDHIFDKLDTIVDRINNLSDRIARLKDRVDLLDGGGA